LDAQNQMLLQRSAKQAEEILRVRMELNRRESELRRASPAVGLGGFDTAPRETTSLAGQIDLPTEMIFAPSNRLTTGAGRRITLVPHP